MLEVCHTAASRTCFAQGQDQTSISLCLHAVVTSPSIDTANISVLHIYQLIIVVSPPCKVINPWNNERITKLSCDSKDAICAKTATAAKHQRLWSQSTMQERIALVLDAARLLKADAKGLAQVRQQDGRGTPLIVTMCIDTHNID
jgi:acyl-CoA reductase-like NAD-dependent aldehyde dehydrogenase